MDVKAGPPVTQLPIGPETPPKRAAAGRPRGARTRADAPSKSNATLETRIGGMLVMCNAVVFFIPGLGKDALDPVEIAALAKAMAEQARQSPRFRKYLEAALSAGSGGQLFGVMALIGLRRAARHGLAPAELDMQLGNMLAQNAPAPAPAPPAMRPDVTEPASGNGTA